MTIDASEVKKAIKPKADSTLNNMKKSELIEYIRCLEHNYNTAVWFNENQARYIEKIGIENVRSQWTSVKDRLPKINEDVWCYSNKNGGYMFIGFIGYRTRSWIENGVLHIGDVTHWMPLPELPKEDAE